MHRLIQISDTHLSAQHGFFFDNFCCVADAINEDPPNLVVASGDLSINGPEVEDDLDFAFWCHQKIAAPVRFLPGNHDVGEEPGGEHLDQPITEERLAAYRKRFGLCRWRADIEGWRLIGLNSQLFNTGFGEENAQWRWLEDHLAAGRGPIGVFLHKPIFAEGPGETPEPATTVSPKAQARLHELFLDAGVRFVSCGHVHQRQSFMVDGIMQHWCPSTAFRPAEPREGCDPALGFYEFTFNGDQYKVAFRTAPGLDQIVLDDLKENGKYAFLKDVPSVPVSAKWRSSPAKL